VTLTIYDVMGKTVKTLVQAEQPAGEYAIHWDGKDASGQPVASGTYFYKLISGDFAQIKRMVLVR
jgi:flagellar hook assembly protein FlgD